MNTSLYPFPHWFDGEMRTGSTFLWSATCLQCKHHSCKSAQGQDLQMCSYGYNYQKINDKMIVAGIIVREYSTGGKTRSKLLGKERDLIIPKSHLDNSIRAIQHIISTTKKEIRSEKDQIIADYIKREQYKSDFIAPLKQEILKGLSFVHDYKQINAQISQNINVIIEQRYVGETFEEKLKQSMREERAIYEASKFLDEKLNVAKFLMHPEWLESRSDCVRFRFHGVVIKYRRIYSPRFENKVI